VVNEEQAFVAVDFMTPNVARIYDYVLGGKDNFAVDRAAAEELLLAVPDARQAAFANRAFLDRVVRTLAEAGIHQFLDIGAGLPTQGSVHQVAQEIIPDARVVYADIDPVVLAHSRALVGAAPGVGVLQGDLRFPEQFLDDPVTTKTLDLSQPVGVLLLAILHFIPEDQDPYGIMARLISRLAPGSYIAISHGYDDGLPTTDSATAQSIYDRSTSAVCSRGRAKITKLLDGCELLPPGIVPVPEWRPDNGVQVPGSETAHLLAAVARVR
jgi:hypothetical protein